ncbi:hypothetical protein DFR65_10724 [Oceanihabitans sediminis]|uniref:Uncharacterized protein n=2 Tax=Oceanihabitans sediminis TaxID=1812012 RepID=A0A368P2G1_9FLAO|nr:hypothetical protein [Oceanihabitans sediminis]RBP28408.1 hypothetical protein DFR65_10724 [Oceanihabitans sediminis]RCU56606.1 hypothetical protein DU428_11985 [Oceanihabitans sediminis]
MKKIYLLLITTLFLIPKHVKAQSDGAAIAAAVTGAAAIGAMIASIDQMEEQAELTATQWILYNHPELTSFSLKTLSFDGKKAKDMSSTTVITYKIQEFTPEMNPELNGKKQVLFGFTSPGWISDYGIDFNKVNWFLIDSEEWMNMMVAYVKVSSDEKNESSLKETLKQGKIVNKGVRMNGKMTIPFFKLSGDMYVVTDYSSRLKLLYNERSLGIYLKETQDLVQIGRRDIIDIHEYFFAE